MKVAAVCAIVDSAAPTPAPADALMRAVPHPLSYLRLAFPHQATRSVPRVDPTAAMSEFMGENDIEHLGTHSLDIFGNMYNAPHLSVLGTAQNGVSDPVKVTASANRLHLSERDQLDDRLFDERPTRISGGDQAWVQNFTEFCRGEL